MQNGDRFEIVVAVGGGAAVHAALQLIYSSLTPTPWTHFRLLVGVTRRGFSSEPEVQDSEQTRAAKRAVQIVTVAIRRTNIGRTPASRAVGGAASGALRDPANTAGCYSAADAVRTLCLARELLDGHKLVKLEVLVIQDVSERVRNPQRCGNAGKEGRRDGYPDDPIIAKSGRDRGAAR